MAGIGVGLLFDLRNPPRWQREWESHCEWHLRQAEAADGRGIGSILFSEHHFFEDGYLPQPLLFAAAVAARTSRVRLGSGILLAGLRHPLQVAEEAAVLDVLSGGRLDLGLGAGYRVPEFEAFGADLGRRFALVEEQVKEIRRLWEERVTPRPLQRPLPIWGGFYGPRGVRLAGQLGLGLLAADHEQEPVYREGLEEGGHDPAAARMKPVFDLILADDPEAAWEQVKPHLAYKWDSYRAGMVEGTGKAAPRPIDPERWRQPGPQGEPPRAQVLTPSDAAAFLRERCAGLPVVEAILWGTLPGLDEDLAERHLELAGTELVAELATG